MNLSQVLQRAVGADDPVWLPVVQHQPRGGEPQLLDSRHAVGAADRDHFALRPSEQPRKRQASRAAATCGADNADAAAGGDTTLPQGLRKWQ